MTAPKSQTPTYHACPQCGAKGLEFAPQLQKLQCTYCGWQTEVPRTEEEIHEYSYEFFLQKADNQQVTLTEQEIQCPSCGAITTFDPRHVADLCAFCGTYLNVQPRTSNPLIAPQAVRPFAVPREQASGRLLQWLGQHWFAPNDLKQLAQPERLQGIYLPFWTFDSHTRSFYRGERGEYYYETETYRDSDGELQTHEVRRTRWYSTQGWVERFFDDVLVPATRSVRTRPLERLMGWSYSPSDLRSYSPAFLSGYRVERYQVPLREAFAQAQKKMDAVIREDVRQDIGGDEQRIHSIKTQYNAVTFKHVLLPVWLFSYRYRGKVYQVMACGVTGRILGDYPLSIWKVALAVIVGLIVAGIALWAILEAEQEPQWEPPRQEQGYTLPKPSAVGQPDAG
ncbi:primosomal protein N' (replication factor Y) - superfamily II helicase [Gloeomargarita sp.]